MNPRMIRPIVDVMLELAAMGVQLFVTTHDYFLLQELNLAAIYPAKHPKADIQFISLYKDDADGGRILAQCAGTADELTHNSIMEEFDELYDREQVLMDDD